VGHTVKYKTARLWDILSSTKQQGCGAYSQVQNSKAVHTIKYKTARLRGIQSSKKINLLFLKLRMTNKRGAP
jgi:hypothetical protein